MKTSRDSWGRNFCQTRYSNKIYDPPSIGGRRIYIRNPFIVRWIDNLFLYPTTSHSKLHLLRRRTILTTRFEARRAFHARVEMGVVASHSPGFEAPLQNSPAPLYNSSADVRIALWFAKQFDSSASYPPTIQRTPGTYVVFAVSNELEESVNMEHRYQHAVASAVRSNKLFPPTAPLPHVHTMHPPTLTVQYSWAGEGVSQRFTSKSALLCCEDDIKESRRIGTAEQKSV